MDKEIWLTRHGESEANAGLESSDPAEVPLTANGVRQAEAVAELFSKKPSMIAISKFWRARQTAQSLLNRYSDVPCEKWDVHEFTYLSSELCQRMTVASRLPMVAAYWMESNPYYCDGKGAESFFNFMKRIQKTNARIRKHQGDFLVVFSHKQFIAGFLWLLKNTGRLIDRDAMRDYKSFLDVTDIPNGEIVKVRLKKGVFHV
jgi:broad specificity phosphatase PhoE